MARGAFEGLIVPLITPFKQGRLDLETLVQLLEILARSGVDGFFVGSTTGEYTRLERRELLAVASVVAEYAPSGSFILGGVSSDNTEYSVRLALAYRDLGLDGVVVAPPFFLRASNESLKRHFVDIAVRSEMPLLMYNIPSAVGYSIPPPIAADAASEASNIVGMKVTSYDLSYPRRVLEEVEARGVRSFSLLAGLDDLILPYLAMGGAGAVVGLANVIPEVHSALLSFWDEGNYPRALEEHRKLLKASKLYELSASIPCSVKAALAARWPGFHAECRPPDGPVPLEVRSRAASILTSLGVKQWE